MTQLLNPVCSRGTAEHVALRGLLNAYLRETGQRDPRIADAVPPSRGGGGSALRIALPTTGRTLTGELTCWSAVGHHDYGASFQLDGQGSVYQDLVAAVLDEVGHGAAADEAGKRRLAAQIADSTERISRYLAGRRPAPGPGAAARTRHAEQSVLIGHPMHPTPKSAEGFTDADLAAYAPEQGAGFRLE
ncbi:MAG: IucA/IucC family protein, partial [Micromonosporaceae bacterium]